MRKLLIYSISLLMGMGVLMAQQTVVKVHQANGNMEEKVLGQEGVITFGTDGDQLVINGTEGTATYALGDLKMVTFDENEMSISELEKAKFSVYPNPTQGMLHISGIGSEMQTLVVYSMAGTKMVESRVKDGSSVSLDKLPAGIYLVRCGNNVVKVCKQR